MKKNIRKGVSILMTMSVICLTAFNTGKGAKADVQYGVMNTKIPESPYTIGMANVDSSVASAIPSIYGRVCRDRQWF